MVFLANMLSKMKKASPLGSRIAEVHNGSSLFTGDAGSGESNVRRWIIENDLARSHHRPAAEHLLQHRHRDLHLGPEQSQGREPQGQSAAHRRYRWFKPLRKNLGKKNCELGADDIGRICDAFLQHKEDEASKVFPNDAFGYWKITVERP